VNEIRTASRNRVLVLTPRDAVADVLAEHAGGRPIVALLASIEKDAGVLDSAIRVAFKRDMLTTDLVCLEFRYVDAAGTSMHVEINKDMLGFEQVIAALQREMLGFDKGWRAKVVNPPFAQNETVISRKST
jgi:hypothetical protein